jgi:hypothetical protein
LSTQHMVSLSGRSGLRTQAIADNEVTIMEEDEEELPWNGEDDEPRWRREVRDVESEACTHLPRGCSLPAAPYDEPRWRREVRDVESEACTHLDLP